ncbi:hypothetical protein O1611_g7423 [Lasiodiplodia mahajangana]|uniref:Uncharacterized protein n=1 Tax=Lasiodiplodia mahajangana TaxID=1108764 RepID=A0ACC2JFB8_9PEZI|nr:hypothetical protein O1611_g7423 [Lasiodiplodia mahajangana]
MESITSSPTMNLDTDPAVISIDITMEEDIADSTIERTITDAEREAKPPEAVRVLNMGGNLNEKIKRMQEQGRSILTLCRHSRVRIAPEKAEEMGKRNDTAHPLLNGRPASPQCLD